MPYPRLAGNSLGRICSDGPVARRLAMTAKSRINRRVLRLGRLGRLFPIPILEVRASIPSPSELLAVQRRALHSHFSLFLRKERMSRPSRPKLNNGRAFW